eukprot:4570394-Amphidinium_carterae.2
MILKYLGYYRSNCMLYVIHHRTVNHTCQNATTKDKSMRLLRFVIVIGYVDDLSLELIVLELTGQLQQKDVTKLQCNQPVVLSGRQ